MARGIETLAGPVSENDVIMRENEAPVGAAALMNKQVRKNVPGFYKLPSQEDETPGYMKAAEAGVDQDMAQMDTINNMAGALMRQGVDASGMNPAQIIMLYEQLMGSMSQDADQFGVTDAGDMLNEMAPDGEKLAYIDEEEAGILSMLGGSGEFDPLTGIPSFKRKRTRDQRKADNIRNETQRRINQGDTSSYVQRQIDRNPGQFTNIENVTQQDSSGTESQKEIRRKAEQSYLGGQPYKSKKSLQPEQSFKDKVTNSVMDFFNLNREDVPGSEPINAEKTNKLNQILNKYEKPPNYFSGIPGPFTFGKGMVDSITAGKYRRPETQKSGSSTQTLEDDERGLTLSGLEDALREEGLFGDFKATKPREFYEMFGAPQTTGGLKDFGQSRILDIDGKTDAQGNVIQKALTGEDRKEAIRYNNAIYNARDAGRDGNNNNLSNISSPGFNTPGMETTPGVVPKKDAYKFNVGGTMPYTDAKYTGGKEMQVPIGKRMQLDEAGKMKTAPASAADMMKYATVGGYNQLEDFNNYINRRRKFLGEEEPEYFDEEGNVIMTGMGA